MELFLFFLAKGKGNLLNKSLEKSLLTFRYIFEHVLDLRVMSSASVFSEWSIFKSAGNMKCITQTLFAVFRLRLIDQSDPTPV